jgi:hypothetical protein
LGCDPTSSGDCRTGGAGRRVLDGHLCPLGGRGGAQRSSCPSGRG